MSGSRWLENHASGYNGRMNIRLQFKHRRSHEF
jgi:hypothetical protein